MYSACVEAGASHLELERLDSRCIARLFAGYAKKTALRDCDEDK
jgi:hypothetical protein